MRASRMASGFDRFFISSQDRRLTYQHATRTEKGIGATKSAADNG